MNQIRKYSILECERRFLLPELPAGHPEPVRIFDRYLRGTRLRLRRIETIEGEGLQFKLGHKVRPDARTPRLVLHTSLYLDEDEFGVLSRLPADHLVKLRHILPSGEAIDHHEKPNQGLVILEIDLHTEEAAAAFSPEFEFDRDVTEDEAYTGRELARPPA